MKHFLLFAALLSSAVLAQPFENVTTSVFDQVKKPERGFWAGLPDINGDDCIDAFTGDHEDGGENYASVQDKDAAGKCLGTFKLTEDNISRDTRTRITSNFLFGNWRNDPRGIPSVMGVDLDGGPSAIYDPAPDMVAGGPLKYVKSAGCNGSYMTCIPLDIDGDGTIELATASSRTPFGSGIIRNIGSSAIKYAVDVAASQQTLIVLDVDSDGAPEVIAPGLQGYWKFINGAMSWQADKFVGGAPWASNHTVVADYDLDGDQDILIGYTPAPNTKPFTYGMVYWRNDNGNFINDTATSKVSTLGLVGADYFTSYANAQAADFNNDGWVDVLTCGNAYRGVNSNHVLMNSGNAVFAKDTRTDWARYLPTDADDDKASCGVGDTNNDGFPDVYKTHGISGPNHVGSAIFQNRGVNANKWLDFRIVGDPVLKVSMEGLHSIIMVRDPITKQLLCNQQVAVFRPAYHNLRPHCGLGPRDKVDVEVRLPHGAGTFTYSGVPTGQLMTISARGIATYSVAGQVVTPPVEPPVDPEPPQEPTIDLEGAIEELKAIREKLLELDKQLDGVLLKLETPVIEPEEPEPPKPPLLAIVPFTDNPIDRELLNYAHTAMREWNYGGHNVPWDIPGFVATSVHRNQGYWSYDTALDVAAWLFDRPTAWFHLYQLTNDAQYYSRAVFELKEYAEHIASTGVFDLKDTNINNPYPDTKYLYLKPFWLYKTITPPSGPAPDISQYMPKIEAMYSQIVKGYNATRDVRNLPSGQLWTEREAWVAGEAGLYYTKLTGKPEGLAYAKQVVAQVGPTLPEVSFHIHEGDTLNETGALPTSSPWMAALYFQFARDYYAETGDVRVLEQASAYADRLLEPFQVTGKKEEFRGFFWGDNLAAEWNGVLIPRYLTGPYVLDAVLGESDLQHSLDVLGMMRFTRYAKQQLGKSTAQVDFAISELTKTVPRMLANWTRSTIDLPKYRIQAPRMWLWWIRGRYAFLP